ncbi:phage tail assembly protein [Desulfovibrio sp. ZJ200]|uniref:phage tail assembly protein n=1 Tax=Desulfovibrio sp. ZJ200 TaxID=2709792 RepID=UPI0013ECF7F5|nr:phage tail assembly protein [Desulfovibrio sp. ZJ200]
MSKPRTATIKLDYPVQLADRELTEVTMHRPSMGEIIDNPVRDALDMAGELKLYAVLCGLPEEDLRLLDSEDYARVQQQYLTFRGITPGRRTAASGAAAQ